jgi:hypothetical protein
MSETLGQKRDRFTLESSLWVVEVNQLPGYKLRRCEALRSDEQAEIHAIGSEGRRGLVAFLMPRYPELAKRIANNTGSGIRTSLHIDGLAEDYQLFVNGDWVTESDDPRWIKIGEMWEKRGADHCWGGRFNDAGHVSISHNGRK